MSIKKYKSFLGNRYLSFKAANDIFKKNNGTTILELGTTRSFVDGAHEGCMKEDVKYWYPDKPEFWDWGAGAFTLVFSEEYKNTDIKLTTVDISKKHIEICKIMTQKNNNVEYIVGSSINYLNSLKENTCDFIYQDTCDCDENGCRHHKLEAQIIIEKNLIKQEGIILIDDHCNEDPSLCSKTKYSLSLYLKNNFKIIYEGKQLLLQKI